MIKNITANNSYLSQIEMLRGVDTMHDSQVASLFKSLVKDQRIEPNALLGARTEDVTDFEEQCGCDFPSEYKQFLLLAGKGAGELFRGTAIFYPEVLELQATALDLLQGKNLVLSERAVVFSMHQGYLFHYFIADDGDDPPIYEYHEGEKEFTKVADSFSQFLAAAIESHLAIFPTLNSN